MTYFDQGVIFVIVVLFIASLVKQRQYERDLNRRLNEHLDRYTGRHNEL